MMTAAPPNTDWGIIETSAANLGNKPQIIRKIAPHAKAKRLTILVIVTNPTFCEKDVLGKTPNKAAMDEPIPSQITPPDNSWSVASLDIPPSITPEISPTVSTAVTINIIKTGKIALKSKTGFTGMSFGKANHFAWATLSQFKTHDLTNSVPSLATPVVEINNGKIIHKT